MKETFWALVIMFVLIAIVMCQTEARAWHGKRIHWYDGCGSQWVQCGAVRSN